MHERVFFYCSSGFNDKKGGHPTVIERATSEVSTTAVVRHRRKLGIEWSGWLFVFPAMIFILIFIFIPAVYVVYLSLLKWNLLSSNPKFVGLANYLSMFQAPDFRQSFLNTILLTLGMVVLSLPIGLGLAVLVDMGLRGTRIYRTILFAPYVVPLVGSGLVWTLLYNPRYGFLDILLTKLHIHAPDWLGTQGYALAAVLIMSVWQYMGYYMIIFLGGLQNVSHALKEASAIDGATSRQTFFHVTLPSLAPSLVFAFVVCTIQSFQTFDQVFVMTGGGPDGASSTLVYYIYHKGFEMYQIGISTAASVVLLVLLALLTWFQVKFSNRWVVEE